MNSRADALEEVPIAFFRNNSTVDPVTGCWIWQRGKGRGGYGAIFTPARVAAHRASYEAANTVRLTPKDFVCHRCDTPACVNPDHLFLGNRSDNIRDCINKGRFRSAIAPPPKDFGGESPIGKFGEGNTQAKLGASQVRSIRQSDNPVRALAREYGLDPKTVRQIRNREIWKHVE